MNVHVNVVCKDILLIDESRKKIEDEFVFDIVENMV